MSFNPFTAPACKISGLKDARTHLKNSIFSGPIASPFSVMRFGENPLQGQCEKENKKAERFQILHFLKWHHGREKVKSPVAQLNFLKNCSVSK